MMGFLAKVSIGGWLKGAFIAALVAAVGYFGWQYNAGQRAIERADALELTLENERARFVEELTASEMENATARARYQRDLGRVVSSFEEEIQRLQNTSDILSDIDRAGPDADAPVAPVLRDTLRRLP